MKRTSITILLLLALVVGTVWLSKRGGASKSKTTIAIATLMTHPALDAIQENVIAELKMRGFSEEKNVRFLIRNANGQVQLAAGIASDLASQRPDIIIAITTPMAQAVAKSAECPVVFAAVTDPVGAGLVSSVQKGNDNITGTSDAWPYEDQLKLIRRISPNARKLGVLYNPGEAASQYGIQQIRKFAPKFGFVLVEGAVNSTSEVYPVAQNLASQVDAFFLSSDNTVIGGVAAALKVAIETKKPLYVGDSGTVEKGGLAAVSVGYAALGKETGSLAARMLKGERNIPTVVATGSEIFLNSEAAKLMGVSLPKDVIADATKVYDNIKQ